MTRSPGREIDNLLPNNQRQRLTCYILCHIQYPVSAAHTSTFRMGLNPTSSRLMVQKATRLAFWSGGVRWVLGACECSAGNLVACELMCGMDWGLRHAFWSEATAHHHVVYGDVRWPRTRRLMCCINLLVDVWHQPEPPRLMCGINRGGRDTAGLLVRGHRTP